MMSDYEYFFSSVSYLSKEPQSLVDRFWIGIEQLFGYIFNFLAHLSYVSSKTHRIEQKRIVWSKLEYTFFIMELNTFSQ